MKLSHTEQAYLQSQAVRAGALQVQAQQIMQEAVGVVRSDHPELEGDVKLTYDDAGTPVALVSE